MLYDRVKVQLPTGELKEVDCPDKCATEYDQPLPKGAYVAATCGLAATNTVLVWDGVADIGVCSDSVKAIGWVDAEHYPVGQY